jgi:hypothetical protein
VDIQLNHKVTCLNFQRQIYTNSGKKALYFRSIVTLSRNLLRKSKKAKGGRKKNGLQNQNLMKPVRKNVVFINKGKTMKL